MQTHSLQTSDGICLVYDVVGNGPPLMLLHGGGNDMSRKSWHDAGYVERLKDRFRLIVPDIRGHGESDKPIDSTAYTIGRMQQDILDIADACSVHDFILWGFSYGGNIGRFLATNSSRVRKLVVIGIPFGLAAGGDFRDFIGEFRAKWEPLIDQYEVGSFEDRGISAEDKAALEKGEIAVFVAWLTAMLDWGSIDPSDIACPVLWLSGTENPATIASMQAHADNIDTTSTQIIQLDGLTHIQEFSEIEQVLPHLLAFTKEN